MITYNLIFIPTAEGSKYRAHLVGKHTQRGHQRSAEVTVSASNDREAWHAAEAVICPGDPRPLAGKSFIAPARRATQKAERDRALRLEVENFNLKHPVGTPVRYWTGVREGQGRLGHTRAEAQLLSGHTPVVWIEGCSGCVALTHVEALP